MLADIKKIQNYSINTCLTRLNQGKAGISARAISRGTRFLFFSGSEPVLPHLLPERKWSLTPFSKLLIILPQGPEETAANKKGETSASPIPESTWQSIGSARTP